jgi:hypothetical protein
MIVRGYVRAVGSHYEDIRHVSMTQSVDKLTSSVMTAGMSIQLKRWNQVKPLGSVGNAVREANKGGDRK